jgi:heme-degrading monooxygenase HmoA
MITIGMNYNVIEGKEETFETAFNKVVAAMGGMDGHTETHMFSDINDRQHYLIVSRWSDKTAFDAFIGSDSFRNVVNWGKEQILSGRPSHEIYGGDGGDEPKSAEGEKCPAGMH